MGWQLMLLTTVVVAILGHTDGSTCGASTDGKCQNDSAALLQVAFGPESFPFAHKVGPEETRAKTPNDDSGGPFGPAGPKHQKAELTSMNDWHSSRDLARVWGVQNVKISPRFKVQIFSAVPVFGKDETYIVLLVEHNGDAWTDVPYRKLWTRHFNNFVMFCAGPDGSHKTQVIARGLSWVCPWPREEWENKQFEVLLEDKDGTNLGMVRAEQDPKLLGHLAGSEFRSFGPTPVRRGCGWTGSFVMNLKFDGEGDRHPDELDGHVDNESLASEALQVPLPQNIDNLFGQDEVDSISIGPSNAGRSVVESELASHDSYFDPGDEESDHH
eukprot:s19_g44.t1